MFGCFPDGVRGWTVTGQPTYTQVETNRPAGLNDVGMVAWLVTLMTPECPDGRQAILIANDITHQVMHTCHTSCLMFGKRR